MIEKLDKFDSTEASIYHVEKLYAKINQLIDIVNKHEDIIRQIGEWGSSKGECLWCGKLTEVNLGEHMIGCTTLDIPESYKTEPYAEQRKWIGKLCKFWDYDGEEKWFSILEHIDKNSPYTYCASGDWWYKHCEPVKPDDNVIYKGE